MYMVTNDRRYLDIGESHVANILTYVYENSHGNLTVDRVGKIILEIRLSLHSYTMVCQESDICYFTIIK